jgi:hypothetical protein
MLVWQGVIDGNHRHLSNIDCLIARTVCLVCFISTVIAKKKHWKTGTSSGHITNLQQSILETFDIYDGKQQKFHTKCFVKWLCLKQSFVWKKPYMLMKLAPAYII